jgi:hypothetical protein
MKLDNDTQDFMNMLHNFNIFFFVRFDGLFSFVKHDTNGQRNGLTSIYFVIDKHNVAVEPRKGTWALSAMF